jgi:hypothetical protein
LTFAVVVGLCAPFSHWPIAHSADPDQPIRPIAITDPVILITLFNMPEEGTADSMTWRWTSTTDG